MLCLCGINHERFTVKFQGLYAKRPGVRRFTRLGKSGATVLPIRYDTPVKAIAAVRIWPMSDKIRGFRGKSIAQVQAECFRRDLPKAGGAFSYRSAGLYSPAGTVVLFQFQARIIASAVLLRDEKFNSPTFGRRGRLHFDASSIRTFEPLDFAAMRQIWPGIRPFGHVKQVLNPTLYPKFRRRLKRIGGTMAQGSPNPN